MSESSPFLNPDCRLCREPLRALSADELRVKMTKQHIPLRPLPEFNLASPRYEGWWVEFIFHGRRTHTRVMRCAARLGGTRDHPKDDHSPSVVTNVERPLEWRGSTMDCILGVRAELKGPLEPNMLRVGSFLVFGNRDGEVGAEIQLPIAHLTVWFQNEQIEKW